MLAAAFDGAIETLIIARGVMVRSTMGEERL